MKPVLSRRADADITEIAEYTTDRWGFAQAEQYVGGLSSFLETLAETGAPGLPFVGLSPSIRRVKYRSHFIFFDRDGDCLTILRVLHERMDHVRHLR